MTCLQFVPECPAGAGQKEIMVTAAKGQVEGEDSFSMKMDYGWEINE